MYRLRTSLLFTGTLSVLILACHRSSEAPQNPASTGASEDASTADGAATTPRSPGATQGAQAPDEHPDTMRPPANVSHGEAPVGDSNASAAPVEARLAPAEPGRVHRLRIEIAHTNMTIAPGVTYAAWTFGNRVPGPALHVRQGDTVDFTLVNKAPIPHSLDFHAAEIAPDKYYRNLLPNDSIHYRFVARVPGAFLYHCGTAPVALHIAQGMYGALVVDPARARPKAREFVFVQSEFYLSAGKDTHGVANVDWHKVLGLAPDHVAFNGRASQYAEHPLEVQPNELVRMYVVNAGPNRISSFHVVGGIFSQVFNDGSLTSPLRGVQTVNVPVGGGGIFETRLREPGDYPFVTHAFDDATKGAVGVFRAMRANQTAMQGNTTATVQH